MMFAAFRHRHRLLWACLLLSCRRAAAVLSAAVEEELATDLEAPGVLAAAARRLATPHGEIVFVVTGPDLTSMQMANNSLVTLAGVGLRRHTMMMADSWHTCTLMGAPMRAACFWSSRVLHNRPSASIVMSKFWDWRFKYYYVKKLYNAKLVDLGFAVLQVDTDTVRRHCARATWISTSSTPTTTTAAAASNLCSPTAVVSA